MSAEQTGQPVEPERDALLQWACGDRALPPTLQDRLSGDATLRTELEETCELIQELRTALQPEALPDEFRQRIGADLDKQVGARPLLVFHPFRVSGLAAAAAVVLALLGPWNWSPFAHQSMSLSADEAEEIVAVCRMLDWSGDQDTLNDSFSQLSAGIEKIEQRVERESGAQTYIPWSVDDDWDTAPEDRKSWAPRSSPPLCIQDQARNLCNDIG